MIINNVRGAVYARYKDIATLADKLGWSRQKLSMFVNGYREPSLSDIQAMAEALEMEVEELTLFFLKLKSQKWDK